MCPNLDKGSHNYMYDKVQECPKGVLSFEKQLPCASGYQKRACLRWGFYNE